MEMTYNQRERTQGRTRDNRSIYENARAKSVNRRREQERRRRIKIALAKRAAAIAGVAVATSIILAIAGNAYENFKNPEYANPSYDYGKAMVAAETHRTSDNENYWYDYGDIASGYNEDMDFDSYVYGVFNNIGWNQQSRLEAMESVFWQLELRELTDYESFVQYCEELGVCYEEDGKTQIDFGEYREVIEQRLIEYKKQLEEKETFKM